MRIVRTFVFAVGVALRLLRRKTRQAGASESAPPGDLRGDLRGTVALRGQPAPAARSGTPGRVLHMVTNALPERPAGYTVRTHRIAQAQRGIGIDARVVTRLGFPVAQGHLALRECRWHEGVPYHRLIPWWPARDETGNLAENLRMAARLVERLRPVVLHAATDHHNAQVALALGRRFGIPVVYEIRGFLEESWLTHASDRSRDHPRYVASRELETWCMRRADLVVTLGEAMREEIIGRGVDPDKIVVIPNAVDERFTEPLPDPAPIRAALRIPDGVPVVGTTSSFYRFEGLDILLEGVAELRRHGGRTHVLLVGDGPERQELRRLASRLGIADVVHFTGRVPAASVRHYHAVLDVFVVPRRNDWVCRVVTPLKPVEAMASGLPVVASNVKASREIVEPEVTGKLIPPEDSLAIAECLSGLLYDRDRCREMGRAARTRVIGADRTWNSVAQRYREAYPNL